MQICVRCFGAAAAVEHVNCGAEHAHHDCNYKLCGLWHALYGHGKRVQKVVSL